MSRDSLPYTDTKAHGAAGFYSGINATFRYILKNFGKATWYQYLEEMGRGYFAKHNQLWARNGLEGVADYWRSFFDAEPGAEVEVRQQDDRVVVEVKVCPAIKHLRAEGCSIVAEYCQHCYFLGEARAREAGMTMRLNGGNGSCQHTYASAGANLPAQDVGAIRRAG